LNFDAYSFPDVGGWIVIAAATLSFVVWFIEWYREHKTNKKPLPAAKLVAAFSVLLVLSSCSVNPEPIAYGKDVCYFCKMGMADPKFGGEVVTKKGKVYKFDDIICMTHFLKAGTIEDKTISKKVVINFQKQNDFIDVETAFLLVSADLKTPMGSNAAAFVSQTEAEKAKANSPGKVISWIDMFNNVQ
jgi:copper chaperone NosL